MSLSVKIGDRVEFPENKYGKSRIAGTTHEVLQISFGNYARRGGIREWYVQLRNVRGTKKWWCPMHVLWSPDIRHYTPIFRRK